MKRVVTLLLAAPLLNLNAQRADAACARHQHAPVEHAAPAPAHAAHAAAPTSEPSPADEECETPAQKDCCHAVVTCSLDLGLRDPDETMKSHASGAEPRDSSGDVPASRVYAPEPPPPRA